MNGKHGDSSEFTKLRWRAEEFVQTQGPPSPKDLTSMSREEALRLVHELRVHQIELRMQNEELSRAQAELTAARERYFDLYNLAPLGYFIISHDGRILETNQAGVVLLGVPRAALIKQPITRFILTEDQDIYYLHRRELLATGEAHTCELRMVKDDGSAVWVRLTTSAQEPSAISEHGGSPPSRVVLSDISGQKQIEQAKAKLDAQLRQVRTRAGVSPKPGRGKRGKARAKAARR